MIIILIFRFRVLKALYQEGFRGANFYTLQSLFRINFFIIVYGAGTKYANTSVINIRRSSRYIARIIAITDYSAS